MDLVLVHGLYGFSCCIFVFEFNHPAKHAQSVTWHMHAFSGISRCTLTFSELFIHCRQGVWGFIFIFMEDSKVGLRGYALLLITVTWLHSVMISCYGKPQTVMSSPNVWSCNIGFKTVPFSSDCDNTSHWQPMQIINCIFHRQSW